MVEIFHYLTTNLLIPMLFLDFPPVKMEEIGGKVGMGSLSLMGIQFQFGMIKNLGR